MASLQGIVAPEARQEKRHGAEGQPAPEAVLGASITATRMRRVFFAIRPVIPSTPTGEKSRGQRNTSQAINALFGFVWSKFTGALLITFHRVIFMAIFTAASFASGGIPLARLLLLPPTQASFVLNGQEWWPMAGHHI